MPRLPRKSSTSAFRLGLPRRQHPTADSLSETTGRTDRPQQVPAPGDQVRAVREGIITAHRIRE